MKIVSHKETIAGSGEITKEYADKTFEELLAFQGYGFCKAHATSYSVYSAIQMWLQEHYFLEYMATLLTHIDRAKEKKGVAMLDERVKYCIRHGTSIYYPDVNKSGKRWEIKGGGLLAPLSNIKNFGDKDVDTVIENRPYSSIKDFMDKTGLKESKFEMLLFANAFSSFGDVETLYNWYHNEYNVKKKATDDFVVFDFGAEFNPADDREITTFSQSELENKCFEMNGFLIEENLLITLKDVYENKEKYLGEELTKNEKIYSIQEAIDKTNETVEEEIAQYLEGQNLNSVSQCNDIQKQEIEEIRKEKMMTKWVLAKVKKVSQLKSKQGRPYSKIFITDGITHLDFFGGANIHSNIKPGNVVVMPLSIGGDGSIRLDSYKVDKKDIFLVER